MPESTNFIQVYDDALTIDFCNSVISTFESCPQIQSAGQIGSGVDATKKDSVDCGISEYREWEPLNQHLLNVTVHHLKQYVRKYQCLVCGALAPTIELGGEAVELSLENFDQMSEEQLMNVIFHIYRPGNLNMQKYQQGSGGYHHWHSEIYPRDTDCTTLHRVLLFMFFLNDVHDGGETEFLYQKTSVKPKAGRMVIAPAGFTHTHKGNVPKSADKYIVTSWILFQKAEQIYGLP